MEIPKGWGGQTKKPSVAGVWMFSGTTHSCSTKIEYNARKNVYFDELLQYFNTSNDFLKQL